MTRLDATPCKDASTATCDDPSFGRVGPFEFVDLTGTVVNRCIAGDTAPCNSGNASTFLDPSYVALDYANFPFSRETPGEYFYAVVAAGYEKDGFFQGAVGNLSDTTASTVAGDLGSGDTLQDRTIVIAEHQVVQLVPTSPGTHAFSFPPSQFMTIQLFPFDTTPGGDYVLALCPTSATSRCDCAFDAFSIVRRDGGSLGSGGNSGAGGAAGGSAGGSAGAVDAGPCHDM